MDIVTSALISHLLDKALEKFGEWIGEKIEERSFKNKIEQWCSDFISKNEGTVISGGLFARCLEHYYLVEHLLEYIYHPVDMDERAFLQREINLIQDFFAKEKCSLSSQDKCAIREFVAGLFSEIISFFYNKMPPEDVATNYAVGQIGHDITEIFSILQDIRKGQIGDGKTTHTEIQGKTYQAPADMITRKVGLYRDIQNPNVVSVKKEELFDACLREKHIVLLGEAGTGKSVAVEQLAAQVSGSLYFPVIYRLNGFYDQSIDDIIKQEYPGLEEFDKVFLILDAYDEIQEKDRHDFERKINEFVKRSPSTMIVISTRSNFYYFADEEGNDGSFSCFAEYGLIPISQTDIVGYLSTDGIDSDRFFEAIADKNLTEFVRTPFFLCELKKIYKEAQELPDESDLMDTFIRRRFGKDVSKYRSTVEIRPREAELFNCLEELAFAIQCMSKNKLTNREYTGLFTGEIRQVVSYSGVFGKDEKDQWGFEHNNFREYLTAEYMLRLSPEEIMELVCGTEGIVTYSWVNTLSFLLLRYEDDRLFQLLEEKNAEMLLYFERSRIDESKRTEIAIRIMEDHARKALWLSYDVGAEKIAKFGYSTTFAEYLIEQVVNPTNDYSQSNSLRVLSELPGLCGMEEEARAALFACLTSSTTEKDEKVEAMSAIASLKLHTPEITDYVIAAFRGSADNSFRLGVLKYLYQADLYEDNIDLFIEEFGKEEKLADGMGTRSLIMKTFSKVSRYETLCKVIECLSEYGDHYSSRESEYERITANAVKTYRDGFPQLLNRIVQASVKAELINPAFFAACAAFFDQIGRKAEAFMMMADLKFERDESRVLFAMEHIADENCYSLLLSAYEKEPQKYEEIVGFFYYRFSDNDALKDKFKDALQKNGVVIRTQEPRFDYPEARTKADQLYVDSLFDKERYCALAEDLVTRIGERTVTFKELDSKKFEFDYDDKEDYISNRVLSIMYHSLSQWEKDDRCVIDVLRNIANWDVFITDEAFNFLHGRGKISLTAGQLYFFKTYCEKYLSKADLSKEISNSKEGNTTYTSDVVKALFFSSHFGFDYDKTVYLKMLYAPPCFFEEKDQKGNYTVPTYLTDRLTKKEIAAQIRKNILSGVGSRDTLDMYLAFCTEEKLDYMVDEAVKICDSPQSAQSWKKWRAIDYLLKLRGHSYVYDRFLATEDAELLDMIVRNTLEEKDERLKNRLEEILRERPDEPKYLHALITLNSREGLKRYCELTKEAMAPAGGGEGYSDSAANALSEFSDMESLPELESLRKTLFTEGFRDRELFGLSNGLYHAYENLAGVDYEKVTTHLTEAVEADGISNEEKHFCNTVLKEIEQKHNSMLKEKWAPARVKKYLQDHRAC